MNIKFLYNHNKSTPIGEEIKQLISDAQDEIIIVAPYISKNPLVNMIGVLNGIKIKILTRLSLADFISNSSDINILNNLVKNPNIELRYYSNLHAKIYFFDGKKAVITSANFTQNGMYNNLEYGVLLEANLRELKQDINNLWNNAGMVNNEIIALIQDELNILEERKKQAHKIKNEINKINKHVIKQKRSHPYKRKSSSRDSIKNSISKHEALDLVINECDMKIIKEKSRNRDSNIIVNWKGIEQKFYIIDEKKAVYAIGKNVNDGFIVLKGSSVSINIENSLKGLYFNLRMNLVNEGVITRNGNEMVFQKDYKFTKSSPAASVVLGRNETGLKYWKLKNGMTLGEYLHRI